MKKTVYKLSKMSCETLKQEQEDRTQISVRFLPLRLLRPRRVVVLFGTYIDAQILHYNVKYRKVNKQIFFSII